MPAAPAVHLLPLSADSADALDELREACAARLRSEAEAGAAAILHGAAGVRHRAWRLVATGASVDELIAALERRAPSRLLAGDGARPPARHVAWLLEPAHAPAASGLERLRAHSEPFAAELEEERAWLRATWDADPLDALHDGAPPDAVALAALQLALAGLWRRCGPAPSRIAGEGAAALAALALAGALSRRDALHLVAAWDRLAGDDPSAAATLEATAGQLAWRATDVPLVRSDGALVPAGAVLAPADLATHLRPAADAQAVRAALAPADDTFTARIAPSGDPVDELARAFCSGLDVDLASLLPAPARVLELPPPGPAPSARAPQPAPAPDEADAAILAAIVDCTARELGIDPDEVAADATFVASGADSLLMVSVLRQVEHAFDVAIGMRELFELADTPQALARLVMERRADGAPAATAAPAAAPQHASAEQHLAWLVEALSARTRGSKALAARFRGPLADSRASVGFRAATKELLYPIVARTAAGAQIEDVDGNAYVDIAMGFGTQLFGHDPPFLREAIEEHLAHGLRIGPRSEDTGVAAELLCELTGAERVAFAATGTEANAAALRIARAATGRDRVVVFHDAYHGHFDSMLGRAVGRGAERATVPASSGVPQSAVDDVLVLDYGSDDALETIAREGERIAAVLVEPVQSRHLDLQPRAFLHELRRVTERSGTLLAFDEMLTGLRAHPRGAQGVFELEPDLSIYGKALGGGYPLGAIAGRRAVMDHVDGGDWRYGDDSRPQTETTFFGGTYIQHPLSMAAARAVLGELRAAGPALQERLTATTTRLAERLDAFCAERELPLRIVRFGSQFRFAAARDLELLFPHLLLNGVYVWEWRNFFLSTAHADDDVERIATATERSLDALCAAGCIAPRPRARTAAARAAAAAAEEQRAPLSFAQESMWFTAQLHPGYCGYNEPEAIGLDGPLDVRALEAAFDDVARSQELLRARIAHEDGVPSLRIAPHAPVTLPVVDVAGEDERETVEAEIARASRRPFDLERGPLWRTHLLRFGTRRHVLVLSLHHTTVDLVSMRVLMRELSRCYAARRAGEEPAQAPHRPYAEYVERQRALADSAEVEADARHWADLLTPLPPPLELPLDRPRPADAASEGTSLFHRLDAAVGAEIDALCGQRRCTPFMCLLAAFAATLRTVGGQPELVIGTPIADQPREFADTIGPFINTLPLRLDLRGADTFDELLRRTREVVLDAQEHDRAPFEEIVRRVNPERKPGQNPLFQVSIELGADEPGRLLALPDVAATLLEVAPQRAPFDMTLRLSRHDRAFRCQFEYATALFARDTVASIVALFDALLRAGLADPDRPLDPQPVAAGKPDALLVRPR
jgi:glutamate-1-semialdehyde aminotransferase/acyl carrier protein